MASTEISGRIFQKSLMEMIHGLVWKNGYLAKNEEAKCDRIYTDKYESAARKLLEHYSVSDLKMITDYSEAQFNNLLNKLPPERAALRDHLITFWTYEEPNTYYRMLYGKPPLNFEHKYGVYVQPENPWGLDYRQSIHDAPLNILLLVENAGVMDYYKGLIEQDKTFLYVNHMTHRKIYPFVARLAQNFDLLYVPEAELSVLSRDFREMYQMCRDFIVIRYYSEAYYNQYEYYEGMVGMSILFQTIQQMHVKYLEADITRDFYDLDSIKIVYEAYSVPFFENIPVFYHQKIIKAMNRLLMYKGGNQVFFDLCALFDFESLDVFKYYLCKTIAKYDENDHPIIERTLSGNIDYEKTYKVFFAKGLIDGDPFLDITDENNHLDYWPVTSADPYWVNDQDLLQKIYRTDYNYTETKYIGLQMVFSMTKFMFESCYFMQMLAHNRHNVSAIHVSHGKLGFDIDLFTLVVYIHAIIYRRLGYTGNIPRTLEQRGRVLGFNFRDDLKRVIDDLRYHESEFHKYHSSSSPSIKVHGPGVQIENDNIVEGIARISDTGYITFTPNKPVGGEHPNSGKVYVDILQHKSYIWDVTLENPRYVEYIVDNKHHDDLDGDDHQYKVGSNIYDDLMMIRDTCDVANILNILEDMQITNNSSCVKVYNNIKELYRLFEDRILRCKDPDTYFAYKHLYKLLLTTEETADIFLKSDGTVADNIIELLEDLNMSLAVRISTMSDTQLVQELQYSLAALEKIGAELKYIQSYGGMHGKIICEYLYQLIRVFKSAKVDLVDFRAIYVIDGRMTNLVKFMVKLKLQEMKRDLPNGSTLDLNDDVRLRMIGGCNRENKYDLFLAKNSVTGNTEYRSHTCTGLMLKHQCANCNEKNKRCGCIVREPFLFENKFDMLFRLSRYVEDSFAEDFKDKIINRTFLRRHAIANDKLPLIDDINLAIRDSIIKDTNMFVDKLIKLE